MSSVVVVVGYLFVQTVANVLLLRNGDNALKKDEMIVQIGHLYHVADGGVEVDNRSLSELEVFRKWSGNKCVEHLDWKRI